MKKTISLILVVLLVVTMAIPAFATMPETIEPKACIHSSYSLVSATHNTVSVSNTKHRDCYDKVYQCTNCSYSWSEREWMYGTEADHSGSLYQATCNGTTQTWYYRCDTCNGSYYTNTPCPKPHDDGYCNWLPV